jgi:hypothetical protein
MKRISRLLPWRRRTAAVTGAAGANVVTDWNQIMFEAALADNNQPARHHPSGHRPGVGL